jgi:serine protease inhibitor
MLLKKFIVLLTVIIFIFMIAGCGLKNYVKGAGKSNEAEFSRNDYKKIVSSNNQLGFDLLPNAPANNEGNIFISPTSLFIALSMLSDGAGSGTKKVITKVLHMERINTNELNKANASLMAALIPNASKQIQLNFANSVWISNNYKIQPEFAQNTKNYFNAKIQNINVSDEKSSETINDWVKKSTKGKIEKMVDAPLNSSIGAILINAIYFKGGWKYEFDKQGTFDRPFYLEDGSTKNVPLMTLNEKELANIENDIFQAVSLPYGNGEMSMNIFLPKKNTSLEEFKHLLNNDNWKKWSTEFKKTEVMVTLPKFQIEYEVKLNETLKKLGMESAFNDSANFRKLATGSDNLYIERVLQKTFIDVNEEGTEATGATSVEFVGESARILPFEMIVNRPFFFAITDNKTDTILFMGAIKNPQ